MRMEMSSKEEKRLVRGKKTFRVGEVFFLEVQPEVERGEIDGNRTGYRWCRRWCRWWCSRQPRAKIKWTNYALKRV